MTNETQAGDGRRRPEAPASDDSSSSRPTVLVTGGARRVGKAICLKLARAGYHIVLTWRKSQADAIQTCRECEKAGGDANITAAALKCDLSSAAAVEQFLGDFNARFQRLDALVHNASMYSKTLLGSITEDDLLDYFRVNAVAPLLISQALAPRLIQSRGSIVCMCDMHVMERPRRGYLAYSMSKAALAEQVHTLARELAPHVRVNGLAPGVVAWPDHDGAGPAEIAAYEKRILLGRPGTPEDAAEVVLFLVRDAHYVTGEIIRVDGGRYLS